jgi:TRAP transporter TAXI family solute receptor
MKPPMMKPGFSLRTFTSRDFLVVMLPVALVIVAGGVLAVKLMRPAPPSVIRFITGPTGSTFRTNAVKYKKHIEAHGVKVEIVESQGSLENLRRLVAPKSDIDVGFVQGGLYEGVDLSGLVSLGTMFPLPLLVFERMPESADRLTDLKGKRLAIGPEGSGTRALALTLLKDNRMDGAVTLSPAAGEEAARLMAAGEIDAAFLMGDTATSEIMKKLRAVPGVHVMNFRQADAYARVYEYLDKLTLPEGAMDFAENHPDHTLHLVSTPAELIARDDLHPALSDLLIAAAREIHGASGMFRDAGEYPKSIEHEIPMSEDAERYYKSGGQFLYKRLPFWLASLIDRVLVVLLPLLVVVVPATRVAPQLYRWRVRSRIYRWYGALMAIDREVMASERTPEMQARIGKRLDEIEQAVNDLKTPPSFADQLYVLREHVGLVRGRLKSSTGA